MFFQVLGRSMEPSYPDGRRVWAGRLAYLWRVPARGDVVVLRSPEDPSRQELKRIVGLPHEELAWGGQRLRVNGRAIDEPYVRLRPEPPGDDLMQTCRLGPREYFVAGDNRFHSRDSRHYGPVLRRAILARVKRLPAAAVAQSASRDISSPAWTVPARSECRAY